MTGQFGLKLWSTNTQLLEPAAALIKRGRFQYIELSIIPGTESAPFQSYDLPYCIHITTDLHGVNIASRGSQVESKKQIAECIGWADRLNARHLIMHPGVGELEEALRYLGDLNDDRILIENMPRSGIHNEELVGYSPSQIQQLMGGKFGFCLDLNHTVKAAFSLKVPYLSLIREFLELHPVMFHISDGQSTNGIDEHLPIGAGDYDMLALLRCVRDAGELPITLETPRADLSSLSEDLANLEAIKQFNIL